MSAVVYERYGPALAVLAALLLPFKVTLGYIGLIPLITLWLITHRCSLIPKITQQSPVISPLIFFFIIVGTTSLFGINTLRSLEHFGTLFFFPLTIFAIRDLAHRHTPTIISALLIGVTIACFSTLMENAFPLYATRFLGPVSQSGQISLLIFLGLGAYFSRHATTHDVLAGINIKHILTGVVLTICLTIVGFSSVLKLDHTVRTGVLLLSGVCIVAAFTQIRKEVRDLHPLHSSLIITLLIPIIHATLLINLKRGPWVGIFIGAVVFSVLHAKRLLLPLIATTIAAVVFLNPIQSRLLASEAHFFITGGRNAIWQIGGELALKYPLGIGFENSGFLQKFSSEIPPNLKHFHSNPLNILVEAGWIGLLLYLYAFGKIIRYALMYRESYKTQLLATSIGCGIIAWQVAGFVEYNFGDSSIVNIAYMMIGILIANETSDGTTHESETPL